MRYIIDARVKKARQKKSLQHWQGFFGGAVAKAIATT